MFRNYFKITFRNLWRHKVFSLINIIGLAAGMSACLLIYFYVSFELSYDRYHTRANRIYRLVTYVRTPSEDHFFGAAPAVGPAQHSDFPDVLAKENGRFTPVKSLNCARGRVPPSSAYFEAHYAHSGGGELFYLAAA